MSKLLVIRADAGVRMGTGHVMRCLALAQEWQARGGQVKFLSACIDGRIKRLAATHGCRLTLIPRPHPHADDWRATSLALARHPGSWIVLDGYHFDSDYHRRVKQAGHRLLIIDDTAHMSHYPADILLNENVHAEELRYATDAGTRLLLGPRYALLRLEFLRWRGWRREIPRVARKVLITMGGSDPHNQTVKALGALERIRAARDLEIRVVIGPGNPHLASVRAAAKRVQAPVRLIRSGADMAAHMAWADLGIASAGTTCLEFAFLGLPALLLIAAENQRKTAEGWNERGTAVNLGWYDRVTGKSLLAALESLMLDSARRKAMSEEGRKAVHGSGAEDIVSAMEPPPDLAAYSLSIRPADRRDTLLFWHWANDPSARAVSFHQEFIPLAEHRKWYRAKLHAPGTRIWILELGQTPVAQIRYDRIDPATAEISLSVAPRHRGLGVATLALTTTVPRACRELGVRYLRGLVLTSNQPSMRLFAKAGFAPAGETQIEQKPCRIFMRQCDSLPGHSA